MIVGNSRQNIDKLSAIINLTAFPDRNVSGLKFSENGESIHFNLEDSGENHIARMPSGGGDITRPVAGNLARANLLYRPMGSWSR